MSKKKLFLNILFSFFYFKIFLDKNFASQKCRKKNISQVKNLTEQKSCNAEPKSFISLYKKRYLREENNIVMQYWLSINYLKY